MPTVPSKWNVGFQAQEQPWEQLRTVLLTEWKAAIISHLWLRITSKNFMYYGGQKILAVIFLTFK
jgi:hypothetical protein